MPERRADLPECALDARPLPLDSTGTSVRITPVSCAVANPTPTAVDEQQRDRPSRPTCPRRARGRASLCRAPPAAAELDDAARAEPRRERRRQRRLTAAFRGRAGSARRRSRARSARARPAGRAGARTAGRTRPSATISAATLPRLKLEIENSRRSTTTSRPARSRARSISRNAPIETIDSANAIGTGEMAPFGHSSRSRRCVEIHQP